MTIIIYSYFYGFSDSLKQNKEKHKGTPTDLVVLWSTV